MAVLERAAMETAVGGTPCELVRDDSGPAVENTPGAIMAGLRRELDRVCLTHESSCICIISPDGTAASVVMDVLGERITSCLRSYDALYRFADDKYLVMLPQIDRDGAIAIIKRVRVQVISEPLLSAGADTNIVETASFGGTMLDSRAPLHEHMDRASQAHEWALKGMGDSICMWTPQH